MAKLTQRQIAKISQVSQPTVSRVLQGDPRVDAVLRERVLAAVAAHDYAPDARAQSLRSRKSGLLGFVAHRSPRQLAGDPFFSALVAALIEFGSDYEYHLCVEAARTLASRRSIYEELLRTRRVDGLILIEPETQDDRITRLKEAGFPFVLIGRYEADSGFCSVDNDNVEAGALATRRLLARGCRRIAYIGGPQEVMVSKDRLQGYQEALAVAGVSADPALIQHGDFSEAGGIRCMERLLELPQPPDAVLAIDDITAVGALRTAKERGRRVPEQVAILGFNDSWFCPYVDPPLTSVSVNIRLLARAAIEMLIGLIAEEPPTTQRHIIPCHLVERASA